MDFQALLTEASSVVATWTPKVLGALAVLIFGRIFAGWLRAISRKALRASSIDDILIPFLSGMIYVATIVMVVVTASVSRSSLGNRISRRGVEVRRRGWRLYRRDGEQGGGCDRRSQPSPPPSKSTRVCVCAFASHL